VESAQKAGRSREPASAESEAQLQAARQTQAGATASLVALGSYPTAVQLLEGLSTARSELWVKRDDLTHPVYGGNKVRKLEWILGDALARGHRRIVTVGATGSHHVLATTYFGRKVGIEIEAVLVPQPATEHAEEVLRASLAQGLRAFPVRSWGAAAGVLAWRVARGAHFVTIGGSSAAGAMGYVSAARELAAQVRAGDLPEPDVCVVALGSGGTAAGLAAGFELEGLKTRVVGVCVSQPPWVTRLVSLHLARRCARSLGLTRAGVSASLRARLVVDTRFLGRGYGFPTRPGDDATSEARMQGLTLDPTYTAKTFACALWYVRAAHAFSLPPPTQPDLRADAQTSTEPRGRTDARAPSPPNLRADARAPTGPTVRADARAPTGPTVRADARAPTPANLRADARAPTRQVVLYWHTLSSAPLAPLIDSPSSFPGHTLRA
jgi:1-aminocyclopropane-1-carboxylate deaminase/D-cysteine desulfhydrase-like pyridoxal-dependent ACC family enzyme